MKTIARLLFAVIVLLVLATASQAGLGGSFCLHDEEIETPRREEAEKRLDEVWRALKAADIEKLNQLSTAQFRDANQNVAAKTVLEKFINILPENLPDPILVASCNAYQLLGGESPILFTPINFPIVYSVQQSDGEYFCFLYKVSYAYNQRLYSIIFKKEDGEWRLQTLSSGYYSIEGKTAPEWIDQAEVYEKRGDMVSAGSALGLAQACSTPLAGGYWGNLKDRLDKTLTRILSELKMKFSFPIPVDNYEGNPTIYSFKGEHFQDSGAATVVTVICPNFKDPEKLKKLANYIHNNPKGSLPDFKSFGNGVAYLFFTEAPSDPSKQYQRFGVVLGFKQK